MCHATCLAKPATSTFPAFLPRAVLPITQPTFQPTAAEDGDGHLTAAEIATALNSRGVEADVAPIQEFINGACSHCV